MLEKFLGKPITTVKAYGVDECDFTPQHGRYDFSVGALGYVLFEAGADCFYISTDGISTNAPARHNVKELLIPEQIVQVFSGAILQGFYYENDVYHFQFKGLELITRKYEHEPGYEDRDDFSLNFPWF